MRRDILCWLRNVHLVTWLKCLKYLVNLVFKNPAGQGPPLFIWNKKGLLSSHCWNPMESQTSSTPYPSDNTQIPGIPGIPGIDDRDPRLQLQNSQQGSQESNPGSQGGSMIEIPDSNSQGSQESDSQSPSRPQGSQESDSEFAVLIFYHFT